MPIFVIGCHRSGTTLTRYVLDTHPEIACPPETKYLSALVPFIRSPRALPGINNMGAERGEIRAHLREFASSFLRDYADRKGKSRWADKTPNYYQIVELLDYIFEQRALFVFVVRHPLDVIPSLQYYMEDEFMDGADEPLLMEMATRHGIGDYGAAKYWNTFNERLWVFSQCIGDRAYWLHYEDLVGKPADTMTELFSFLGEDFDPAMIDRIFTSDHDHGFEFGGIKSATGITAQRQDKWRSWTPERIAALWEIVAPQATRFGYRVDPT